jgi:tripartite-type tricarboxylate transporter receptor subunit TctC
VSDVVGGHVEFGILPLAVAAPLIESGKVKLVGLGGKQRMKKFPNTQTVNEVLPGAVVNAEWGLTLPKNTPQNIVDWYTKTFAQALASTEIQNQLYENYMIASSDLTPKQMQTHINGLREDLIPISRKLKAKSHD